MKIKYICCLFFLGLFGNSVFSQSEDAANLAKYWSYRTRLNNYFVSVGPDQGQSVPCSVRNQYGDELSLGDGPVYMGYYLGVLSTEYQLLGRSYQPTDQALTELKYALKALRRMDILADQEWIGFTGAANPAPTDMNGFTLRDDIPVNFLRLHTELNDVCGSQIGYNLNDGIPGQDGKVTSNYALIHDNIYSPLLQNGNMESCDHSYFTPSVDNIIGLLMGYALVERSVEKGSIAFIDTYLTKINGTVTYDVIDFVSEVQQQTTLLTQYLENGEFMASGAGEEWNCHYPDGLQLCNKQGGDGLFWCYGIAKAAQYITGTTFNNFIPSDAEFLYDNFATDLGRPGSNDRQNIRLAMICAAICDDWNGDVKGSIVHQGQWEGYGYEIFYGLLNRYLNSHSINDAPSIDNCSVRDLLTSAPQTGPYYHTRTISPAVPPTYILGVEVDPGSPAVYALYAAPSGWGSSYRFFADSPQQDGGGGFTGNFNGLDYMLLHNLFYLAQNPITSTTISGFYPAIAGFGTPEGFYPTPYIPTTDPRSIISVSNLSVGSANLGALGGSPTQGYVDVLGSTKGIDITSLSVNNGGHFLANCQPYSGCEPDYTAFDLRTKSTTVGGHGSSSPPPITNNTQSSLNSDALGNYPNPVSSETTFSFNLEKPETCTLEIFDLSGKKLKTLIQNKALDSGAYNLSFDLSDLGDGIYCYTLYKGPQKLTRKLVRLSN